MNNIEPKQELERGITITHVGKQETLEEANWKVLGTKNDTFYNGAKWQAERMYSEEDLRRAMITIIVFDRIKNSEDITQYITQLKKK
jgi:hypothetical protein